MQHQHRPASLLFPARSPIWSNAEVATTKAKKVKALIVHSGDNHEHRIPLCLNKCLLLPDQCHRQKNHTLAGMYECCSSRHVAEHDCLLGIPLNSVACFALSFPLVLWEYQLVYQSPNPDGRKMCPNSQRKHDRQVPSKKKKTPQNASKNVKKKRPLSSSKYQAEGWQQKGPWSTRPSPCKSRPSGSAPGSDRAFEVAAAWGPGPEEQACRRRTWPGHGEG